MLRIGLSNIKDRLSSLREKMIALSLPPSVTTRVRSSRERAKTILQAIASFGGTWKDKVIRIAAKTREYLTLRAFIVRKKSRMVLARIFTIQVIICGIIAISLFAMGTTAVQSYYSGFGLVLFVDGQEVAFVYEEDQDQIEEYIEILTAKAAENYQMDVNMNEAVEYVEERRPGKHADLSILKNELQRRLSFSAQGYRLLVDGSETVILGSLEEYQEVVTIIESAYISEDSKSMILNVNIEEDVDYETCAVAPEDITGVEEAANILLTGTARREIYLVSRGDSLWTIARSNDISLSELQSANPQLNGDDMIRPGDELNLIVSEPIVNVSVVKEITETHRIPYDTDYSTDSSMWRYQTRVLKAGSHGEKEVDYRVVLQNGVEIGREKISEEIIKEPVTQLVARGTANIPSFGTGRFRWPLPSGVGTISSPYGWRWGRIHTGADLASSNGTAILASDTGVVVFSGYRSSYGNLVIINHGNGYTTYYAHNSKNLAREGQKVDKGDTIALMGRTGYATGTHLHFEIRYNGNHLDPMTFFRP